MARVTPPATSGASTPSSLPTTPPPPAVLEQHSWLFQGVMEIQRSIGALQTEIRTLSDQVNKFGDRLEKVEQDIHGINIKFAWGAGAVAVVLAIVGIINYLVPEDIKDRIMHGAIEAPLNKSPSSTDSNIQKNKSPQ